jgi:hypothetical protein
VEWLRRELWGTGRRRVATVAFAFLLALVVAGAIAEALDGGSSSSTPVAATIESATNPESAPEGASCTTGPVDHDMRATFYGVGPEACTRLNQAVAKDNGEFWRVAPAGSYVEGSQLVCSMAKDSELIEIRDTGGHEYGIRFCAGLTAKGWIEKEGPGAAVERERKAREATEKADEERSAEEQREREARQRDAEQKREEAKQKREDEKQEAESKRQIEADESQNREDERRNREETRRAEEEANRP